MTISDYISKIKTDRFRIYYREFNHSDYLFLDRSDKSELLRTKDNLIIDNSIINSERLINDTFNLIATSENIDEIEKLAKIASQRVFPNRKNSFFDLAIIFEYEGRVIGGVNVDSRNRLAKSIENQILYVAHEELEELIELYKRYDCQIIKNFLPPSIPINNHWTNYQFPSDFYYNPAFETFEANINSGLMCVNFLHARIEMSPTDNKISLRQIQRVEEMQSNRFEINNYLRDRFWESYNFLKVDFELPDLKDKEQLYHFVKASSISVPAEENEPISIFFRTWDEEHGQTVYYYNKDKIEFE